MRDDMARGNGYGSAPGQGEPAWDQGMFRDDARAYSPEQGGHGSAPGYGSGSGSDPGYGREQDTRGIPGPRRAEPGSRRAGGGRGGPGGPGGPDGPDGLTPGPGHRRGGQRGRRKAKSRRRKILQWTAIGTSVAVLGSAGAAFGYYEYLSSKIRKGQRVSGDTHAVKAKANANGDTPLNILILGSDSRADPEDQKLGGAADSVGERADVIMIAHLSADRTNMSMVSIPRDTRVDIPACEDPKTHKTFPKTNDIINASLARGGAGCTLATVQNLTGGLYIDHWLKIDFAGVVKMADVLGGADVCVQQNVDDHSTRAQPGGSHLHMTAGTHTVKGQQALQWLRTRHAFGSDAGRSKAQHMYMGSLLRNLRSQNLFSNPGRLNDIATKAMEAFQVSSEIGTPKKLYDLGMQLKSIPPNRTTMLTMPRIADPQDPNAHYLPAPSAGTVWALMRNDVAMDANGKAAKPGSPSAKPTAPAGPPAAAASTIPVSVLNGTSGTQGGVPTQHRAADVAQVLVTKGFTKAAPVQQAAASPSTTLVYPSSGGDQGRADALAVAKALGFPDKNVKASSSVQAITLTVGADWKTGGDYAKTLPTAGSVPSDSDAMNGSEDVKKNCMFIEPTYRF
ncbi:LCP family protein [Actinacidiphila rubida]|uniref:Transcriptional attenuator, LytR family n=1 Tax=Actinacidiphila rubida TaxID=310780 RepID=A0A1H8R3E7_9ACTN|nr:LCP family protein [Actinacidiphila rubida]SEO60433.1 transcriptional attenuator, LytR family [Actinacidiphila rubida]